MASNDFEVIEKIEQALRLRLWQTDKLDSDFCYIANEQKQVTALRLRYAGLGLTNIDFSLIKRFDHLQYLDLRSNNYNNSSDFTFLNNLRYLKKLDLGNNQIRDCSTLKELIQLQTLNLSWNIINNISALKELSQLQTLNLRSNQISDISTLNKLSQLQMLDLRSNKINDISVFKELNQLQVLDLSYNKISDTCTFNEMSQLQVLDLRYNQISNISSFKALKQLTTLYLGANEIREISILNELNQLQILDLRSNQISDVSPLSRLNQLQQIDLAKNQITDLFPLNNLILKIKLIYDKGRPTNSSDKLIEPSPNTGHTAVQTTDCTINVDENPLTNPPPEIIQQGREAIRAYFQSLQKEETVRLHEAKVLLVGEGMAGKTSLLKQFQGLDFDENESQTHGIKILSLSSNQLPGFNNDDECRLHFWDFGGQEIMHASHRFFMSNRSLYILVLDSRTDSKKFHWLRHIEKYGGKSPLIVAMNKIDINPSYNIEQKSINASFPWIDNRFFRISCKNQEGLPELMRSIATAVPNTPLFGMEISKSWLAIRTELEQATEAKNYIDRDQFIAICEKHGVKDEISRMTLLRLLNDLGTVLFFENLPLTDIYVLDPHWVTVGVYKIINSEKTKDGLLRETDLEFILNEEKIRCDEYDPAKEKVFTYTRAELRYLIQIMQEFKLCYLYSESEHLYISCPINSPKSRNRNRSCTVRTCSAFSWSTTSCPPPCSPASWYA